MEKVPFIHKSSIKHGALVNASSLWPQGLGQKSHGPPPPNNNNNNNNNNNLFLKKSRANLCDHKG